VVVEPEEEEERVDVRRPEGLGVVERRRRERPWEEEEEVGRVRWEVDVDLCRRLKRTEVVNDGFA